MVNLKPEQIIEFDGFDVYSADDGSNLSPFEVAEISFPEDKTLRQLVTDFALTWDGNLFLVRCDGGTVYVYKEGKYLIQINGEKYMRW